MKPFVRSLLAFSVFGMAFQCCREHDDEAVITQTVEKTVTAGTTFSVALPGDADDVYSITTKAQHAAASVVEGHTYTYTAGANPAEDRIVLTATEQGHHGGRGRHGKCGGGGHNGETEAVVTVIVHVQGDSATAAAETRIGG